MTRARIKDIAKYVGVSTATVSRALSDSGLVAEPTRSRIRNAAEELNYHPNVSARNLRMQKSMAVLMVVRDVGNPFYLEVFKGVESAARAAGYSVLMGNTENDLERELEYFDMLRAGHADGMILMTGKLPANHVLMRDGGRPIVVALELIKDAPLSHVQIDNVEASKTAVRHLIELGHKKIAHLSGPVPEPMSVLRREGYRLAMTEAGLDIPLGYEPIGDFSLRGGQEKCRELYSHETPPTAVFAANDEMAFGLINELRHLELRVPEDVSVVGFDDIFLSEAFHPSLTTISQPRVEIGERAMTVLLDVMAGRRREPKTFVMNAELKIRGSTATPRQSRLV